MSMLKEGLPTPEPGVPDEPVHDSLPAPLQEEIHEQFAAIVQAQDSLPVLQVAERHGAGFITQGAVGWIESQVRGEFGRPAEVEANLKLEELIKNLSEEWRSQLFVRVGRQAVLPYKIDPYQPDVVAEPFNKRHALGQGSLIELSSVYEDMETHHGAYHDRQPQSYVGNYTTFLPIAWIGRILNQEGELVLKLRDRR